MATKARRQPGEGGLGSSPLTRGAHLERASLYALPRIIPAHAGSTEHAKCSDKPEWDHPRSRGEHSHFAASTSMVAGSSPLTRGAR